MSNVAGRYSVSPFSCPSASGLYIAWARSPIASKNVVETSSIFRRPPRMSRATAIPSRRAITNAAPAKARSPGVESLAPLSIAKYSAT